MATSPLFGWEEPDDTDLVKDGAAAIRTLGNAIDTSMGDLLGGTSGQVLSKASNTNMDFTWVTSDDANAIQNAIVDAKGDLIAASAADTPARLAVGANGLQLVSDSAETTGLKWGYATNNAVFASNSVTQVISNATWTSVALDVEQFDVGGYHSNVTNNSRFTVPTGLGGKYFFNANVKWANNATGPRIVRFRVNNTTTAVTQEKSSAAEFADQLSTVWNLSAGDYVELQVYQGSGGNLSLYGDAYDARATNFSMTYLGA
jgi:hypothetical protein